MRREQFHYACIYLFIHSHRSKCIACNFSRSSKLCETLTRDRVMYCLLITTLYVSERRRPRESPRTRKCTDSKSLNFESRSPTAQHVVLGKLSCSSLFSLGNIAGASSYHRGGSSFCFPTPTLTRACVSTCFLHSLTSERPCLTTKNE